MEQYNVIMWSPQGYISSALCFFFFLLSCLRKKKKKKTLYAAGRSNRDTLNPSALKMNTTSNAVRTKNVNKQRINAEQTPKNWTQACSGVKNEKRQNDQQWRAGSLKHSHDLWHTFAPNNIECQQMYGSVGKYEKTKKEHEKTKVSLLTGPR